MDPAVDLSGINFVEFCHVAVDIGGTNARVSIGSIARLVSVAKFQASSRAQLVEGLNAVARDLEARCPGLRPRACCVAVAGPVHRAQSAVITNYAGASEEERTLRPEHFPALLHGKSKDAPAVVFLNDLEAACYGLAVLSATNSLEDYFECLWGEQRPALQPGRFCVMSVGTGLGTAGIICPREQRVKVVPMEGGHALCTAVGLQHPLHAEESALFADFGSDSFPPEFEDFVSGRGLQKLYTWAQRRAGDTGPALLSAQMVHAAAQGNACAESDVVGALGWMHCSRGDCAEALQLHYRYLARCSQALVISVQLLDGVFWCGDNNVANQEWIRAHAHDLRADFRLHTKAGWLANVPLWSQKKSINLNLHGCMYRAQGAVVVGN